MTQPTIISGRYKVIQQLGCGGFGVTFLAEDIHLPSQPICVIKKLKPIQNNPEICQLVKERFKREAVVLEELGSHPQIPQLFAYFEEAGEFYLVQEYIQGQTLEALVQQQGIQSEDAVKRILLDILEIIEFIEAKRIIHRDIKPENIILRATDQKPILIDFGAVREIMGTQLLTSGNSTSSIVIGTPGFMPAEQASGRPVFSSDLYALALTMIYLLTGQYPQNFPHDPLTGELEWATNVPISQDFAQILNTAIQGNQQVRFLTATAMKNAVLNLSLVRQQTSPTVVSGHDTLAETTISAEPPIKKMLPQWAWLGFAAVFLVSFGTIYTQWQNRQEEVTPMSSNVDSGKTNSATTETAVPDVNQQAIEEQKRQLAAQQEQLAREKEAFENAKNVPPQTPANTANTSVKTNVGAASPATAPLSSPTSAIVFEPPSNVRSSPNGSILCSVRDRATINILGATGEWYQTDVCGSLGVIHSSQIRLLATKTTATTPQLETIGVAIVFDPPSNVRDTPNGKVLCAVEEKKHINIYSSEGDWYQTDVCGTMGVIHSSQLTFKN